MKLSEWIAENADKEIEIQDGKIVIKELKSHKRDQKPARWKPEAGEKYYYISDDADVYYEFWSDFRCSDDHWSMGNVFRLESEARDEIERLKIRAELLDLGGRTEFRYRNNNFIFEFDHNAGEVYYYSATSCQNALEIYFDSEEEAENAVKAVGEKRIKKYLFGWEGEGE